MGKLQTIATATTTVEHQVKLSPRLQKKLLTELRSYASLKVQADDLDFRMKKAKGYVEEVLGEIGESNLAVEGFKTTLVCAKGSSKLDPMKLLAQGVTTKQLEAATVVGPPKAPYILISCPDKGN